MKHVLARAMFVAILAAASAASAQNVKVTPLGSHAGELCARDRATIFGPDNMSLTLGPANGYVIRFTNGLVAYLSGDTGLHAEMWLVARDFYHANLMELNYGASALSPEGAAYAVNDLVQPASVIVNHVNEAATSGGKVKPDTRTAAFIALVKGRPVYPALSGKTLEFDGSGKCVAGC